MLPIILLCASVFAAPKSEPDHVLDLTVMAASEQERDYVKGPIDGGVSGGRRLAPALKLELSSLDRLGYETGDPLVFEVLLENTGNETIVLPWSSRSLVDPGQQLGTSAMRRASLFLEVRESSGIQRLAWLVPQVLHGSSDVEGSLKAIEPGQTALIRVPSSWVANGEDMAAVLRKSAGAVRVYAVLHLLDSHMSLRSENGIEVVLRSRLRR